MKYTSNCLPIDASDATILAAVDRWAALLEAERYDEAFSVMGNDPVRGWTPALMREVITQYDEAAPGQKVTLEGKPTDVTQRKRVRRFAKNKHGVVGEVWYDLNINGLASDLTATFSLRAEAGGLVLVLDDIHVM
ncbi:MAG TPA: hypothetical protein VF669_18305 [Tepidisphaeraceae bacterium]